MRRRSLALALLALVAIAVTAVVVTQTGASERGELSRLSNAGRSVTLQRGMVARQAHVARASLLAVRGRTAVYRLTGKDGTCYGTGDAADIGEIGSVECARGPFPTAERPVLDLSIYEGITRGIRELSLYRVEGIAADGVAAVAFLRRNGSVALQVPVTANVFATTTVPRGPIAGIAALDAAGKELWRSP
jgi:hypothetical protein